MSAPSPLPLADACLSEAPAFGSYFVSTYPPFSCWLPARLAVWDEVLASSPPSPAADLILYVHLPFCAERCRYCYYLAHDDHGGAIDDYLAALLAEARRYAATPYLAGRRPTVVYVGGGTPSLLSMPRLATLLDGLRQIFPWDDAREVTFECAPRSVTAAKVELLRAAGVTRLSMGVQQLDDPVLERSGRIHRVADVLAAWRAIADAAFPVTNLDLMAGMVGESEASFVASLDRVIELAPASVTIYQLEIPLNTPLYRDLAAGREAPTADWEVKRERLLLAFDRLAAAGYTPISAYAAVRDPLRHPFLYQSLQYGGADLLGLGVASFSYLGGVHQQNEPRLERYLAAYEHGAPPWGRAYALSPVERAVRELVLQLKLLGVDRRWFAARHGFDAAEIVDVQLADAVAQGLLTIEPERIVVCRAGLPLVDRLLPALYLPEHRGVRYS